MPHQMLKFRIDNYVFQLRREAHSEGRRYGWLDWSFMRWEWVGGTLLLIGSVLLTVGSILFLPECGPMANHTGSWVFVASSVCYMTTSTHDFLEIVASAIWSRTSNAAVAATSDEPSIASGSNKLGGPNWMEWYAAVTFLCGATLFMVGTTSGLVAPMMMDSMDPFLPTAWSFIIGSCCCLSGSMVNSMQIWDAPDRKSAQYANMIAINYIIGSSFYLCGSIPYLYFFHHEEDKTNIMRCVAMFFIIGSVLFFVGAVINMYRVQWNEKYDPEFNWHANQQQGINKKPKRTSSDHMEDEDDYYEYEDPLFGSQRRKKKKNGKYHKATRRPSDTLSRATSGVTDLTRATSVDTEDDEDDEDAVAMDDSVPFLHNNNPSEKHSSFLDYSRRRRISAYKSNQEMSHDLNVSSGLWT